MRHPIRRLAVGLVASSVIASGVGAASIPAWLDDAITTFNGENPDSALQFVDIKDSFVWYRMPSSADISSQDIRQSIYDISLRHDYRYTDKEESVTTGKPPTPTNAHTPKKCWTRSFVTTIHELSDTRMVGESGQRTGQRQRVLTSMVCQEGTWWWTGFRTLQ